MTNHEQERDNIRSALEQAREDWLAADTEIEKDIQAVAIDHLLDVGLQIGAFALADTIDKSSSV